jgi:hypothetical protein
LAAPVRYAPGPLQPPPGSSGAGLSLAVYVPTTLERPYALVAVAEERWPVRGGRWFGAPRRACHAGTREVTYESGSVVLLLSLRDCQVDPSAPPRWPTEADLAAVKKHTH